MMDINTRKGMADAIHWTQHLIDSLVDGGSWVVGRAPLGHPHRVRQDEQGRADTAPRQGRH